MWIVSAAKAEPELAGVSVVDLVDCLTLWMFRGLSSKALSARLSALSRCKVSSTRVTRRLKDSGDLLGYKVFLAYCIKHKLSTAEANALLTEWKLPDSFILGIMLLRRKTMSWIRKQVTEHECLTFPEANERIERYVRDLQPWLGRFVGAKLRFIATTQRVGLTRFDLYNDLWIEAIKGYTLTYPAFASELHAINVMKRTMHNGGINLIQHYTRKKNSGVIKENGMNISRLTDIAHEYALQAEPVDLDVALDVQKVLTYYQGRK